MRLLADTANIKELEILKNKNLIEGVTTNPSIISKEGKDGIKILKAITELLPDMPVFGQVVGETVEDMVADGKRINSAGDNMVVKIPANYHGVEAIARLSELGIKTCATAILTAAETVLCAQAGATYVAPYAGQNDIIGYKGVDTLSQISTVYKKLNIDTKIVAASIEKSQEIVDYFMAGADCLTLPYHVFEDTFTSPNPLTEHYINNFKRDWMNAECFFE